METVQYYGGYSVLQGDSIITAGGSISTAEAVQYCGGSHQCCGGIASVLQRDSISTVKAVQYSAVLNSTLHSTGTTHALLVPH